MKPGSGVFIVGCTLNGREAEKGFCSEFCDFVLTANLLLKGIARTTNDHLRIVLLWLQK